MAEFPGFTIWTDAYLADTGHLSTLEHGAYLLLLMRMWRAGGKLPNDDKKLARCAGLSLNQWEKVSDVLMDFFTIDGDHILQGRLQDELEKARGRSKKAAESARAKYRKNNDVVPANAEPEHCSEPASISITITNRDLPSVDPCATAFGDFQKVAKAIGIPVPQKLSKDRSSKLKQRLSEHGLDGWRVALANLEESDFLQGKNGNGWKADFDFLLQPSSLNKLIEGSYANRPTGGRLPPAQESEYWQRQRRLTEEAERRAGYVQQRNDHTTADEGQPTLDLGSADYRVG